MAKRDEGSIWAVIAFAVLLAAPAFLLYKLLKKRPRFIAEEGAYGLSGQQWMTLKVAYEEYMPLLKQRDELSALNLKVTKDGRFDLRSQLGKKAQAVTDKVDGLKSLIDETSEAPLRRFEAALKGYSEQQALMYSLALFLVVFYFSYLQTIIDSETSANAVGSYVLASVITIVAYLPFKYLLNYLNNRKYTGIKPSYVEYHDVHQHFLDAEKSRNETPVVTENNLAVGVFHYPVSPSSEDGKERIVKRVKSAIVYWMLPHMVAVKMGDEIVAQFRDYAAERMKTLGWSSKLIPVMLSEVNKNIASGKYDLDRACSLCARHYSDDALREIVTHCAAAIEMKSLNPSDEDLDMLKSVVDQLGVELG